MSTLFYFHWFIWSALICRSTDQMLLGLLIVQNHQEIFLGILIWFHSFRFFVLTKKKKNKQNRRNLGDLSLMNEFSMRATLSDDAGNLRFNYLHADLYGAQTWAKLIRPIQKPPKKQYDFWFWFWLFIFEEKMKYCPIFLFHNLYNF